MWIRNHTMWIWNHTMWSRIKKRNKNELCRFENYIGGIGKQLCDFEMTCWALCGVKTTQVKLKWKFQLAEVVLVVSKPHVFNLTGQLVWTPPECSTLAATDLPLLFSLPVFFWQGQFCPRFLASIHQIVVPPPFLDLISQHCQSNSNDSRQIFIAPQLLPSSSPTDYPTPYQTIYS